jgi:replicative DNA helicase
VTVHDPKKLLEAALRPKKYLGSVRLLDTGFRLLPTVHMIAAVTKHGKTNLAANLVVAALSEYPTGFSVVALNEETAEDFVARCACIRSNVSFRAWKMGSLSSENYAKFGTELAQVVERVRIVDSDQVDMGCMEDAARVVRKAARTPEVRLVVFDYLQNIYKSKAFPSSNPYELYKLFGVRAKDLGKHATCPVVVMAQLKEASEDNGKFKSRVEGDTWFANNVASGIELKADKRSQQSTLTVQIDRFQGLTHEVFWFDHKESGRLVSGQPKLAEDEG